jgi:hypothetical protein
MKMFVLAIAWGIALVANGGAASFAAPIRSSPALGAFSIAWDAVTAYSATVTVFEQHGAAVQNVVFSYTFRRPSTVTVDVVGGPNNGVSLLWKGGPTLTAHRSGLASAFKETLSLHDAKVTTIRGSSIDELSFARILAHAQQTAGAISQSSGPLINGVATDTVTLIPAKAATDAGYTREIIEISRATHLPLRIMGYQGATLVRKVDFVSVAVTR